MKVICIDDEDLVLKYLVRQLKKIAEINNIEAYNDPKKGLEQIWNNEVDIVFLDINLPGIKGIELANEIMEKKPNIMIVFVTAYEHYAVDAFRLNAVDYLVKPIQLDRLQQTVDRAKKRLWLFNQSTEMKEKDNLYIKVSDYLGFSKDNEHYESIQWRTTKAEELFIYLLQNKGTPVDKFAIKELLWRDLDKDDGLLHTTVYNIRKSLVDFKEHIRLRFKGNGYLLELNNVTIDLVDWENTLTKIGDVSSQTIHRYEEVMRTNKSPYLNQHRYVWLEAERERIELLWCYKAMQMAAYYKETGNMDKAVGALKTICNRKPEYEEPHYQLMKLYAENGDYSRAAAQYEILHNILQESLGLEPSKLIKNWYKELIEKHQDDA